MNITHEQPAASILHQTFYLDTKVPINIIEHIAQQNPLVITREMLTVTILLHSLKKGHTPAHLELECKITATHTRGQKSEIYTDTLIKKAHLHIARGEITFV
jgi:hypothetical protein